MALSDRPLPHQAALAFACASPTVARLLQQTLSAEQGDGPEGSTLALHVEDSTLHAAIRAVDLATLRAAINSVTRLADAALRTLGESHNKQPKLLK